MQNREANANLKEVPEAAQPQIRTKLSPVQPRINLTKKQKRDFDDALPPNVREILEKAEKMEILASAEIKDGKFEYAADKNFKPNLKAIIKNTEQKKEVLETYYADISHKGSAAACWLPNHKLVAENGDKKVEIEICYMCSRFAVKSGTISIDASFKHETELKSENVLNRIILSQVLKIDEN
jgi:hypothetical protein